MEGLNWKLEGDIWAHEYSLFNGGELMMCLSKHWFTWSDSYELDITYPEHELLCLCAAPAVDCAMADASNNSN